MGSFMAECDPAMPNVTQRTISLVEDGQCNELELIAHFWPAKPKIPQTFCVLDHESAYEWFCDSWWTFPPFDTPIDEPIRNRICLQIEISDKGELFQGHVFFDDDRYPNGTLPVPQDMVCVVLHTENVRRKDNKLRAYGFDILVVQPSESDPEKYERLGVGVAVRQSDWHQTRFLGQLAPGPTTSIILI